MSVLAKDFTFPTATPIGAADEATVTENAVNPTPPGLKNQLNKDKSAAGCGESESKYNGSYAPESIQDGLSNNVPLRLFGEPDSKEDRERLEARFAKDLEGIDTRLSVTREKWALKMKMESQKALADLEVALNFRNSTGRSRLGFDNDNGLAPQPRGAPAPVPAPDFKFSRGHLSFQRFVETGRREFVRSELSTDCWEVNRLWWKTNLGMDIRDWGLQRPRIDEKRKVIDKFFDGILKELDALPSVEECIPGYLLGPHADPEPAK